MDKQHHGVIIIGGGIGGLSAALALQRRNVAVRVFERAVELAEVGAGISLWPNAMRVLRCLQLEDAVSAAGSPLNRTEIRTLSGRLLTSFDFSNMARALGAASVCLHRTALHSVLLSALQPGTVQLGAELARYEAEDNRVTAHFSDGRSATATALIGADGLNSVVRRELFGDGGPRYAGFHAWRGVATLEDAAIEAGVTQERWGAGMRFGIIPLGQSRVYWYATKNMAAGPPPYPVSLDDLLAAYGDWDGVVRRVLEATPEPAILRHAMFDVDPMPRWGAGRVTLLGDAAHAMTPNLGQGACQAIEDGWVLAQCLPPERIDESGLHRYENLRRKRTKGMVLLSRRLGRITQWQNPIAVAVRQQGISAVPPWVMCGRMTRQFAFDPDAPGASPRLRLR